MSEGSEAGWENAAVGFPGLLLVDGYSSRIFFPQTAKKRYINESPQREFKNLEYFLVCLH
jgi:hypothetical protein